MRCPKCHFDNPSDSGFCSKCGTRIQPSSADISVSQTETLKTPIKELATGSTFAGRYQIIEELGKGGMGKVYRVLDKKLNEEVALKLIKPEITADKETISRFSNELKLARKIAHRNVGKMYELNLVILKCMKKEKEKRFQNAEELLSELDKIEEEIPTTEKVRAHKIIAKDAAKKISWKRVSLAAAVFLLLMIVVAGVYLLTKRESPIDSIAVLPFDSKYADSETEYITDGLTESLIGALSKLPRLKVISRYSVFQYILKKGGEI